MKKVIIFSAPSGSGKTTLVKYVLEKFPKLEFSISCTTRQPRGQEENAKDYYFFTRDVFREKFVNDDFVLLVEVW